MNERPVLKAMLSHWHRFGVLTEHKWGNALKVDTLVPASMIWARLVVGSWHSLTHRPVWRAGVASAILSVANKWFDICAAWADSPHTELTGTCTQ